MPDWDAEGLLDSLDDERDREARRRVRALLEAGLPRASALELIRSLTSGMARVADATRMVIGDSLLRPGDTELDLARRYAAATEALKPMVGPALEYAFATEVAHRPVQLIKLIGDAAMLVSPEPAPLVDAALTLVAAGEAEGGRPSTRRSGGPRRGGHRWLPVVVRRQAPPQGGAGRDAAVPRAPGPSEQLDPMEVDVRTVR
jgi:hypothetical protein